jgi:hypothetical protein
MKKAQIQMAENIGIMIIFFMLLVFGLIFYVWIQGITYETRAEEASQLGTVKVNQKALYMPEFLCVGEGFNDMQAYCFDVEKMDAAKKFFDDNPGYTDLIYYDMFQDSEIYVEQIIPNNPPNTWVLYNRSDANLSRLESSFPISLYYPKTDDYAFGVLRVAVYYR